MLVPYNKFNILSSTKPQVNYLRNNPLIIAISVIYKIPTISVA